MSNDTCWLNGQQSQWLTDSMNYHQLGGMGLGDGLAPFPAISSVCFSGIISFTLGEMLLSPLHVYVEKDMKAKCQFDCELKLLFKT